MSNRTQDNAAKVDEFVNRPAALASDLNNIQSVVRRAVIMQVNAYNAQEAGDGSTLEQTIYNVKAQTMAQAAEVATNGEVTASMIMDAAFAAAYGA